MSKIEWTNETWNPIIGCNKISEGCLKCYAERMAHRLSFMNIRARYAEVVDIKGRWNGKTILVESALEKPLQWKKPRMIFVCSMGDLFHESIPLEWIDEVWDIITQCPQHTFQILTKRPDKALKYIGWSKSRVKDNIWIGVTTENQEQADKRIPILLKIPAKVRFISCEPLLGAIDLTMLRHISGYFYQVLQPLINSGDSNRNAIDWVIAGQETGTGARPMKKEWIESLYKQCKTSDIPFFDKKDILGLNLKQFPK